MSRVSYIVGDWQEQEPKANLAQVQDQPLSVRGSPKRGFQPLYICGGPDIGDVLVLPTYGILSSPFIFLHWNSSVTVTTELRNRRQRQCGESADLKIWKPIFYSVIWHNLMSSFLTITLADSKCPHLQSRKIVLNELSGCFRSYIWATEGKLESISVLTRVNKILFCWFWALFSQGSRCQQFFCIGTVG